MSHPSQTAGDFSNYSPAYTAADRNAFFVHEHMIALYFRNVIEVDDVTLVAAEESLIPERARRPAELPVYANIPDAGVVYEKMIHDFDVIYIVRHEPVDIVARTDEYFAARFAAKEAFAKALGTGIRGFSLTEVEVSSDDDGRPFLVFHGRAEKLAEGLRFHLSMSHERNAAVAVVVAEHEE